MGRKHVKGKPVMRCNLEDREGQQARRDQNCREADRPLHLTVQQHMNQYGEGSCDQGVFTKYREAKERDTPVPPLAINNVQHHPKSRKKYTDHISAQEIEPKSKCRKCQEDTTKRQANVPGTSPASQDVAEEQCERNRTHHHEQSTRR